MRLTIIGAGAIGGTVGAHLIRDGHDVLFCDTDEAHVEAINRRGLSIEGPVETFTVTARAVTPDHLPDRVERAALAVGGHHAAEPLRDRLSPDGYVVSLQNGLTTGALAEVVGRDRLILGFVNIGADVLAPGRIRQAATGTVRVGEPTGAITPRLRELAAALPYAETTANIMGLRWAKAARDAMLHAGALSDLADPPRWRPLMLAIAREVLAQAPVEPEGFDGFDPRDLEGSLAARDQTMVRGRPADGLSGPLTRYTGELIEAIERGARTRESANLELLAACERAERLGRPLNAVIELFPAPPRAADGPLHGMPIAVKDMIDIAGHPRGNGNPERVPPAAADAPVVTALRAAGADVFAATSLLEYAAGAVHPGVPEVLNPHDPTRTAGGSSGGSAALVGAGVCRAALGTDSGGSIRLPAHYCGCVGFKPSHDALPAGGVQPLAPTLDHVGLLAADVATTITVFTALTGAEPAPPPGGPPRIGVPPDRPGVEPDVAAAVRAAVATLRRAGCVITPVDDSPLAEIEAVFADILLFEAWRVHGERVTADPGHYGPETLRLLRAGADVREADYRAALATRDRLLPAATGVYAGIDALLTPAAPFVAPVTTPPVDTPEGEAEGMFTIAGNVTGSPALVLPCGWSPTGLPIGVQLSAPPGTDTALLAVAAYVESALA